MMSIMHRLPFAALALCIAFWPVWGWYVRGSLDGSNDPWGLLAAATALGLVWQRQPLESLSFPLALPGVFLILYMGADWWGLPISVRAVLAFMALGCLLCACRLGRRLDLPLLGLLLLALPLMASLQFYLGYPLRVLAGILAVGLLQFDGLGVVREGTMLLWDGKHIAIDAPCSGIKMLWTGLYLAAACAGLYRFSGVKTVLVLVLSAAIVILANSLRAATLFYLEAGLIELPPWMHEAAGVMVFLAAGLAIVAGAHWIRVFRSGGMPWAFVVRSGS